MADETMINEEFTDAQSLEVDWAKIWDIERENVKIMRQNEEYREEIDELKAWVQELRSENAALESQKLKLRGLESQKSKLKDEVSRLHHALRDSDLYLFNLDSKLKGVEDKLDGMGKERDLLVAKIRKLEENKSRDLMLAKIVKLEEESEGKEKEILMLKRNIEELQVVLESHKLVEKLRGGLEQLTCKISALETSLDEKMERAVADNFINGKERAVAENFINGDAWLTVERED